MSKLTDEQHLEMAHRMASTYRHEADGPGRHHYGFQRHTLLDFARAVADAAVQAAREGQEPFGYFRAEPFGWTDCAPDDEGAVALYETPPAAPVQDGYVLVPVKPTLEITEAIRHAKNKTLYGSFAPMALDELESIYRAMLAASKQDAAQEMPR